MKPMNVFRKTNWWRKVLFARMGIPMRMNSHAREILEGTILPHFSVQANLERILFVGCDPYTAHYRKYFQHCEYWTIDPDPSKRPFGARRHIVDGIQNLLEHVPPAYFDLIICNGVYGWGMNTHDDVESGLTACYDGLRIGGDFVFGWNEADAYRPVPLTEVKSIRRFRQKSFPPLTWAVYLPNRGCHVYAFFDKPEDEHYEAAL